MLKLLRLVLLSIHFLLASVVVILICLCRPFNPDNTRLCALVYSIPALRLLGVELTTDVQSLINQQGSCLVIANHQSNFDLFMMGSVLPKRTVTVGKKSLKWIPLFGQAYWLSGNVLIDRSNAESARQALLTTGKALKQDNTSLWVFVEGTRNQGKGLLPFKRGAFHMAIDAGVPIIPLCASTYTRQVRLNRWHSGRLLLRSLPAIATTGLTVDDIPALIERCHAEMSECIVSMDQEVELGL